MEPEAAVTNADMAAEIAARLSAAHPEEPSYRDLRATSLIGKGAVLDDLLGKQTEALAEFQAARELLEPLASEFPGTAEYQQDLANVYRNLGVVLETQSKLADAEAEQRKAVTIWQTLVAADPGSPEYRAELAANRDRLAGVLVGAGSYRRHSRSCARVSNSAKNWRPSFPIASSIAVRPAAAGRTSACATTGWEIGSGPRPSIAPPWSCRRL